MASRLIDTLESRKLLASVPAIFGTDAMVVSSDHELEFQPPLPIDRDSSGPENLSSDGLFSAFDPILRPDPPPRLNPGRLLEATVQPYVAPADPGSHKVLTSTVFLPPPPSTQAAPANAGPPVTAGRPVLSKATIEINGQAQTELAVANDAEGRVTVYLGGTVVWNLTGLNHPEDVKLADIDNDSIPDLIIAESGLDRVMIYAGKSQGGFGPEVTGGIGVTVGDHPVGLTIGDIDGDGLADLIVANRDSNTVSILSSSGTGSRWKLVPKATVQAGEAPVKTMIAAPQDGSTSLELLICNSGSNDIYCYQIQAGGQLPPAPSQIIDVGGSPVDMLLGRFSRRPEMDLVTLNSNSENVTYIGRIFTDHPIRQEISTGINDLTAATMVQVGNSGFSDLVVANNDGQIALLHSGEAGLELAGLYGSGGFDHITALVSTDLAGGGMLLYEASSNSDSIAILQFDPEDAALPKSAGPSDFSSVLATSDDSFEVELIPNGSSMSDLVGILWTRTGRSASNDDQPQERASTKSRNAGQKIKSTKDPELDQSSLEAASSSTEGDDAPNGEPIIPWTRFVLGLDEALDSFEGKVAAIAAAEARQEDFDLSTGQFVVDNQRPDGGVADSFRITDRAGPPLDPGGEVDEARGIPWSQGPRDFRNQAPSGVTPDLAAAALGSGVAIRLLICASPPKPPRTRPEFRLKSPFRRGLALSWPEVFPPMSPLG